MQPCCCNSCSPPCCPPPCGPPPCGPPPCGPPPCGPPPCGPPPCGPPPCGPPPCCPPPCCPSGQVNSGMQSNSRSPGPPPSSVRKQSRNRMQGRRFYNNSGQPPSRGEQRYDIPIGNIQVRYSPQLATPQIGYQEERGGSRRRRRSIPCNYNDNSANNNGYRDPCDYDPPRSSPRNFRNDAGFPNDNNANNSGYRDPCDYDRPRGSPRNFRNDAGFSNDNNASHTV
ncbi:unnamed protein product, partial [Allacma fusca]